MAIPPIFGGADMNLRKNWAGVKVWVINQLWSKSVLSLPGDPGDVLIIWGDILVLVRGVLLGVILLKSEF
jgi:hypothetical protein